MTVKKWEKLSHHASWLILFTTLGISEASISDKMVKLNETTNFDVGHSNWTFGVGQ